MALPDPKPSPRVRNIDAIEEKMADEIRCRACFYARATEAHHLVFRSHGGDDVADNIVGLCQACHGKFHRSAGRLSVGVAIRRQLTKPETEYVVAKRGEWWLDWRYPKSSSGEGMGGMKPPFGADNRTSSASPHGDLVSVSPEPGGGDDLSAPSADGPPPGTNCPACKRRVPHPRKKTSPTSAVFSHRGPLDSKDEYKEIIEASAKHGGMTTAEKYWEHEYHLRMAAKNLAGPPGQLVMKP